MCESQGARKDQHCQVPGGLWSLTDLGVNKVTRLQPAANLAGIIMANQSIFQANLFQLVLCPYKYSLNPLSPGKA